MEHSEFTDSILSFLDGDLDEVKRLAFEEHGKACSSCMALLEEISRTYSIIDKERAMMVSAHFYSDIEENIRRNKVPRVIQLLPQVWKPLVAAASITLGIIIGNGELNQLNSNESDTYEYADNLMPATPSDYSIWTSIQENNGNQY